MASEGGHSSGSMSPGARLSQSARRASAALSSAACASAEGSARFVRAVGAARDANPRDFTVVSGILVLAMLEIFLGFAATVATGSVAVGMAVALVAGLCTAGGAALLSAHHRPADRPPVFAFGVAFGAIHTALCVAIDVLLRPSTTALIAVALTPPLMLALALLIEYADDAPPGAPPPRGMIAAAALCAAMGAALLMALTLAVSALAAALAGAAIMLSLAVAAARVRVSADAPAHGARALRIAVVASAAIGLTAGVLDGGSVGGIGLTLATLATAAALVQAATSAAAPRKGERWRHWRCGRLWMPLPSVVVLSGGEVRAANEPGELAVCATAAALLWAAVAMLTGAGVAGMVVAWAAALTLLDAAAGAAHKAQRALGEASRLLSEQDVAEARTAAIEASVDGHRVARDVSVVGRAVSAGRAGAASAASEELSSRGNGWLEEREAAAAEAMLESEAAWMKAQGDTRIVAWERLRSAEAALIATTWERITAEARFVSSLVTRAQAAAVAERRELLLFLSQELGAKGGAFDEAELESITPEEKEALEELLAGFREERRRRKRLEDLRGEEEAIAAEARRSLSRNRERRRAAMRAAIDKGRATTRPLRRELRDIAGECNVLRAQLTATASALEHLGREPQPLPKPSVDAAEVAQRQEAEEAEELATIEFLSCAEVTKEEDGVELARQLADAEAAAKAEAAHRGLDSAAAAALLDEARLGAQLESRRRSHGGCGTADAEAVRHAQLLDRVARWFDRAEGELGQAVDTAAAHAAELRRLSAAEAEALHAAKSASDSDAGDAAAAAAAEAEHAASERRRAEEEARRAREEADAFEAEAAAAAALGEDPLRSLVVPLVEAARRSGQPWQDAEFPATDAVLPSSARGAAWRRAHQFCRAPTIFGRASSDADDIDPSDISQGALGTCYFLSALSVAAARPELIRSCFVTREPNDAGVFCVRFFRDGQPRHVLIDDRFPAHTRGRPLFAASKQSDELWVSILEKVGAGHRNEGGRRTRAHCPNA